MFDAHDDAVACPLGYLSTIEEGKKRGEGGREGNLRFHGGYDDDASRSSVRPLDERGQVGWRR